MNPNNHFNAGPVGISEVPLGARFNLRVRATEKKSLESALGFSLPVRIGEATRSKKHQALCLGPDEWQVDSNAKDAAVLQASLAKAAAPHSLVDITDREVTWRLSGPRAAELLSAGIARDLARIKPRNGARTVFDGVQAVLFRETEHDWILSVWRSFAPHARHLIDTVNEELASGL
jgi:sarcosine oxidase, subunit gamma